MVRRGNLCARLVRYTHAASTSPFSLSWSLFRRSLVYPRPPINRYFGSNVITFHQLRIEATSTVTIEIFPPANESSKPPRTSSTCSASDSTQCQQAPAAGNSCQCKTEPHVALGPSFDMWTKHELCIKTGNVLISDDNRRRLPQNVHTSSRLDSA